MEMDSYAFFVVNDEPVISDNKICLQNVNGTYIFVNLESEKYQKFCMHSIF